MRVWCLLVLSAVGVGSMRTGAETAGWFTNPVSDFEAADPCVVCDTARGWYYFMRSTGVSITLCRARRLADVRKGDECRTVWATNAVDCVRGDIWAPELHRTSTGRWFVYASGTQEPVPGGPKRVALFVLASKTDDPFDGFEFKATLDFGLWAIDPTFHETGDGRMFLAYSTGKKDVGQVLAIRPLANPWTFAGQGVELAQATEPWELRHPYVPGVWGSILEGPYFLEHEGKTFLVYSANGCWSDDYALGVLELTGTDPLDPAAWTRHRDPILVKGNGVFGPGHATFFRSPDGSEVWCAFHGMKASNPKCRGAARVLHLQRVGFGATGVPLLGPCLGGTARIRPPAGEEHFQRLTGKGE